MKPNHIYKGIVIEGNKRGRLLGYPTANMRIDESLDEGVYASTVTIDEQTYHAATFIGRSKTFDDYEYKSESYLLDFDENIYGKEITVALYQHVRGNMKFDSKEALIRQMEKDVEEIQTILRTEH